MLKVILTRGNSSNTVQFLDHDGREIAFHQNEIPVLIRLVKQFEKDKKGKRLSRFLHQFGQPILKKHPIYYN